MKRLVLLILALALVLTFAVSCDFLDGNTPDEPQGDTPSDPIQKEFTVTFYDEDGTTVLGSVKVKEGSAASYTGSIPAKAETEMNSYIFSKWVTAKGGTEEASLSDIRSDVSVYAKYAELIRSFTVRFLDEDGTTVLDEQNVSYGDPAVYAGEKIEKPASETQSFAFSKWVTEKGGEEEASLDAVTSDLSVYASYTLSTRTYTVNFYSEDGAEILDTVEVEYEAAASFTKELPAKESTEALVFTFDKWVSEIGGSDAADLDVVVSAMNVYASFSSAARQYSVKFHNGEALLDEQSIVYAGSIVYGGEKPAESGKIFAGWFASADDAANAEALYASASDLSQNVVSDLDFYAGFVTPKFSLSKPLFGTYANNTVVDFGSGIVSYLGNSVACALSVTDPAGNNVALDEGKFTVNGLGAYTISLTATIDDIDFAGSVSIKSVSAVPMVSGQTDATYAVNGRVAGLWDSGLCEMHVGAGETAVFNTYADWTGKTLESSFYLIQAYFADMDRDDYAKAAPFVFTFYNAEDASEYFTVTYSLRPKTYDGAECNPYYEIYLDIAYSGGTECSRVWLDRFVGNSTTNTMPVDVKGFALKVGNDGANTVFGFSLGCADGTTLTLEGCNFTKAIVTVNASDALAVTLPYFSDARGWTLYDGKLYCAFAQNTVSFYDGENLKDTQSVAFGATVTYGGEEPVKDGMFFVGWFTSADAAADPDNNTPFDFATPIADDTVLYAGYTEKATFVIGKPLFGAYGVGATVDLGNVTVKGKDATVTVSAIDPDGNPVTVTNGIFTTVKAGKHIVTFTATVNGKEQSTTCEINCVANVPCVSGQTDATYAVDGGVAGLWGSGLCEMHVGAGETAVFNTYADWTGKTLANNFFLIQAYFADMDRDDYVKAAPFVFTFYNAEDVSEYFTVTYSLWPMTYEDAECNPYYQIYLDIAYSGGTECSRVWLDRFVGNSTTNDISIDAKGFALKVGNDGANTVFGFSGAARADSTTLTLEGCNFTKAIVTVNASDALAVTLPYFSDARGWTLYDGKLYCALA